MEVQLPAVYVDALVFDPATDRPRVLNRVPQPNETSVPIDSHVSMDLVDVGGIGIDLNATTITVRGQTAYTTGAFQPGYDGPGSAVTTPYPNVWRVVIDPVIDFQSDTLIPVTVHTETTDAQALDVAYSFTSLDLTPPGVISATATERRKVRVTFNEPVLQVDATGVNDALNPGNYTFYQLSAPSVPLVATAVDTETDSIVVVSVDVDMTSGADYRVDAHGIYDLHQNPVLFGTADFTGFPLPFPADRLWDLWRMLPEKNRREDTTGDLRHFIECLQEVSDQLLADIDAWADILDLDKADEQYLDAMLFDLGNPFDFDLFEIEKRRLLRVLVDIYRQKGTVPGIVNAVRFFLGLTVTIFTYWHEETLILGESELGVDWSLGPGTPWGYYAFEIQSAIALTDEQRARILAIADYMKPGHTHIAGIVAPTPPPTPPDHVELGLSELDTEFYLH